MTSAPLCTTPNQHARPAGLELTATAATFRGYQDFVLTRHGLHVSAGDEALTRKLALLRPVFQPALVSGRTVLDLGANAACFSFLALQNGAAAATAVDLDPVYTRNVSRAAAALGYDHLAAVEGNLADWREPADVVVALALVHWLHDCTATFHSLGAVVSHLARLARYALLVEWVSPDDPAIAFFGHLDWTSGGQRGSYDQETFERELRAQFVRVEMVGDVSATRQLFLAFKGRHDVDLSCPLPLLHSAETVISCGRLTVHGGVEYWSRVYDLGATVQKQTTGALASREARVLDALRGASVPRVMGAADADETTSTVTLEKVAGEPFEEAVGRVTTSETAFCDLVSSCLDLLAALREAGVEHRDIHPGNLLLRDGRPVLLDFGWATAPGLPIFTPDELLRARNRFGEASITPRSNSSDTQAMGALLLQACPPSWPVYGLLALIGNPDPRLRIEAPAQLRALLDDVRPTPTRDPADAATSRRLLSQIEARDRLIEELRAGLARAEARAQADRETLAGTELALAHAEATLARRAPAEDVAELYAQLIAPPAPASEPTGRVSPALRPYALAYAAALRRHGHPAAALDLATRLLGTLDGEDAEDLESWLVATYLAASVRRELGRADDALADFERILACDPARVPATFLGGALYHSAVMLQERGEGDVAGARLARCVELLPQHAAARAALARLCDADSQRPPQPGVVWPG